jgi:hypothetical protein
VRKREISSGKEDVLAGKAKMIAMKKDLVVHVRETQTCK